MTRISEIVVLVASVLALLAFAGSAYDACSRAETSVCE